MEINLENYEAFFLDFAEGNLTDGEAKKLRSFLILNPHLKNELDSFEELSIKEEKVFNSQLENKLLREENTALPLADYLMIAQVEAVISTNEKLQLAEMVEVDQSLLSDLGLYHKAKLSSENELFFPNKKDLQRQDKKGVIWIKTVSLAAAAAAAVLALVLMNINQSEQIYHPNKFAYSTNQFNNDATESLASTIVVKEAEKIESSDELWNTKQLKVRDSSPQTKRISALSKVKSLAFHSISASSIQQEKLAKSAVNVELEADFLNEKILANKTSDAPPPKNQFLSLSELASKKIKTEVLKNKSLKGVLLEELATLSNERVSIKLEPSNTQRFAINIGKFSYSNF